MEKADSLFHAQVPDLRSAELGGTRDEQVTDARQLAKLVLTRFQNSEGHCLVQSDPQYVYVAVSASQHFFVVRLARSPSVVYKDERAAFAKLGIKEVKAEAKRDQRILYRPF